MPYVQFLISRIQRFLFRGLFSWEQPLEAEEISEALTGDRDEVIIREAEAVH